MSFQAVGPEDRRNAVQSWSCRITVGPAVCLLQLNVTEDDQERRSLTCRSATASRVPDHAHTCMSPENLWGLPKQDFYRPDALPVTQSTVSKH